ncbi:MAG: MATE family efflux transporter, partial [Clostridia bacterium]|nr:MATE family efflux transporter [Clostridia bacterium]
MIVVGRFSGSIALAATGASSPLINLIINMFAGFSAGINSIAARYIGARDDERTSDTVHTSYALSIVCGFAILIFGIAVCRPILHHMGTPDEVIDYSVTYTRIIFLGTPALLTYNFGAAVLRSMGDTKRPLYFLTASGLINVVLNLIFVIVFNMNVAGVALATVISQYISAILVTLTLIRCENSCHLNIRNIKFHKNELSQIIKLGLPAGIQSCTFAFSNLLIQSSVNSFGSTAMSGFTAGANILNFPNTIMDAFSSTAIVFVAQNYGAQNYKRITASAVQCSIIVTVLGILMGLAMNIFGNQLIGIYAPGEAEVAMYGMMYLSKFKYITCFGGLNGVSTASLRGLGKSFVPMLVSIAGICGFRILWIYTIFSKIPTLDILYTSYPISWVVTATVSSIMFYMLASKFKSKNKQ